MEKREKDWTNIAFLSLTPIVGIFGTAAYALRFGVLWWEPVLFLISYALVGFSITAGYHRFFTHKGYECHPLVQAFYLSFGAMALQNSLLHWAADHRDHHRCVDRDWDPYNIKRGGLWAHIFWLFFKDPPGRTFDDVPDLKRNRLVMWQHRYSSWIGILAGLGLPTLIGALLGRPMGGLLWGGFLRIVVIHHTTFFVNSLAHLYGSRPYTEENSARDNWLVAFVTNGEGYHNFHHKFPSDFRNGVRWYQWDPTKWLIQGLKTIGLADDLRCTPRPLIERARLGMAMVRLQSRIREQPVEFAEAIRVRMEKASHFLEGAVALCHEAQAKKREWATRGRQASSALAKAWRQTAREYRACLRQAREEWRQATRMLSKLPEST